MIAGVASLRVGLVANSVGQFYSTLLGFVLVPVSLRYLGREAYGVVACYAILLTWSQLLDAGWSPILARQLARMRAGALAVDDAAASVRAVEKFLTVSALAFALSLFLAAEPLATKWLRLSSLSSQEVAWCIRVMAIMAGLRLLQGAHRNVLVGLERLVAMNAALVICGTLRVAGTIALFQVGKTDLRSFFACQLVFTLCESVCLAVMVNRCLPPSGRRPQRDLTALKELWSASGDMGLLAALWIVCTQADRLFLSSTLGLPAFGMYSIAAMLAGGLVLVAAPVTQVLQSRYALLVGKSKYVELVRVHRRSCQVLTAIVASVAAVMTFFAAEVLITWTQDMEAARSAAVLALYASGNVFVVLLALAFAVQFAHGRTRTHLWATLTFTALWVPSAYLAAGIAGAVGTGVIWLVFNAIFLTVWMPWAMRKTLPQLPWKWILLDFALIASTAYAVVGASTLLPVPQDRLGFVLAAGGVTTLATAAAAAVGSESRDWLLLHLRLSVIGNARK